MQVMFLLKFLLGGASNQFRDPWSRLSYAGHRRSIEERPERRKQREGSLGRAAFCRIRNSSPTG